MNFKTNNTKPRFGAIWQTSHIFQLSQWSGKERPLGLFLPQSKNSLNS